MRYDEPDTTLRVARTVIGWAFAVLAVACFAFAAVAQEADDGFGLLSRPELEELVGPIALYPDDLIGIVLPAATYPLQVVEAARFLERREDNPRETPDADWDDSIVALLNYPQVVEFLNEDLDWTWSLGDAVLNQRADVLDAIQGFRASARAAGNLRSDDRQIVVENRDVIEIRHADPEVIYVPYYEPRRVVVYQSAPVVHYHPWSYPVYYYPYPVGYRFDAGFFFGVTSAFVIGWHDHYFHVHPHYHHLHPYYGRVYYDPFYLRRSISINVNVYRDSYVWAPRARSVGRPVRFSDGRPVTRTVERRVTDGGTTRTVRSEAGRTTRTTERRANASGANTSTTERSNTAAAARTRTTERSTATGTTRTTPRVTTRTTPAPTIAPRSGAAGGSASTQTRTRVSEGRPTQGSAATQRSTTTNRSSPRMQSSQPSASSRSSQTAQRPSAPSSSAQPVQRSTRSAQPSAGGTRTRNSESSNAGSSRSQSSGGSSSPTRTR